MAQIHLNGGPLHDQQMDIPADRDHFHILEPLEDAFREAITQSAVSGIQPLKRREGMYSQCQGYPGEFEWDGWRSHD